MRTEEEKNILWDDSPAVQQCYCAGINLDHQRKWDNFTWSCPPVGSFSLFGKTVNDLRFLSSLFSLLSQTSNRIHSFHSFVKAELKLKPSCGGWRSMMLSLTSPSHHQNTRVRSHYGYSETLISQGQDRPCVTCHNVTWQPTSWYCCKNAISPNIC